MRERFFTPRLRGASCQELNAWLFERCVVYAKAHKHPELPDLTIWQAFEAERPQLVPIRGPFDGFHAIARPRSSRPAWCGSTTTSTRSPRAPPWDRGGRPVEIQAYADRVMIRQDGAVVGEHPRCFGRGGGTIYNPWHYVPVLAKTRPAPKPSPAASIRPMSPQHPGPAPRPRAGGDNPDP